MLQNPPPASRHDDRRVPNERALEVSRIGQLSLKRQIAPGRTTKDALLLEVVDFPRAVHVEWNGRPMATRKVQPRVASWRPRRFAGVRRSHRQEGPTSELPYLMRRVVGIH